MGSICAGAGGHRQRGAAISPNGHGGYYGDRIDIWYVIGTDAGERITAYLGSTRDELGIVRDGNIEMVSIRHGTRRVIGPAAEITVMGIRGTPGWLIDGALWPDGYSLLDEPVISRREIRLPRLGYGYYDDRRFQWAPEEHNWRVALGTPQRGSPCCHP